MGLHLFLKFIALLERNQKIFWFLFFGGATLIWYFSMKFEGLL